MAKVRMLGGLSTIILYWIMQPLLIKGCSVNSGLVHGGFADLTSALLSRSSVDTIAIFADLSVQFPSFSTRQRIILAATQRALEVITNKVDRNGLSKILTDGCISSDNPKVCSPALLYFAKEFSSGK